MDAPQGVLRRGTGRDFPVPLLLQPHRKEMSDPRNAVRVGVISEHIVATELMKLGYRVLTPLDPASPYDLLIDTSKGFSRVQVKTARVQTKNTVAFHAHARSGAYTGRADIFAVYHPSTSEVFLVPVEKCPNRIMTIVMNGARNLRSDGSGLRATECLLQRSYLELLGPAEAGQPFDEGD